MKEIPTLEMREPVYMVNGGDRVKTELESKQVEVNVQSLCKILKSIIPHYALPEIQGRAMEEIRTFKKHSRDNNKLASFWKMLMATEGQLLSELKTFAEAEKKLATDDPDKIKKSIEIKKFGQIISAVSLYKIELGNNTALLQHLEAAEE